MSSVVRAARANAVLGVLGLVVSSVTMVVVTRTLDQALYAEYASLMALVTFCLLLTEAGGNAGFMRYLHDAERVSGRGSLYLVLMRGRVLTGLLLVGLLVAAGPLWARWSNLPEAAWGRLTFILVAGTVVAGLLGKLAHAGLIGTFRHAEAQVLSQVVAIVRALLLCAIALVWPSLAALALVVLVTGALEALWFHIRIWKVLGRERQPVPSGMVKDSLRHGLVSAYDKVTSLVGGGPFLLLALAPVHGRVDIALLAVAADVVQKALAMVSLPMGSMVLPYLNRARSDPGSFQGAVGKMTEGSSLIFLPTLVGLFVFFPVGIPYLFGEQYAGAAPLAALLLIPVFLDGWVRFVLVSSLLTKGCYWQVSAINTLQAVLVVAALLATYGMDIQVVVAVQGVVKVASSVAVVLLAAREELLPRVLIARGLLGTTLLAGCASAGAGWGAVHAGLGSGGALGVIAVYTVVLVLGVRFRVRLSADLAERLGAVLGGRRWASLVLPRPLG